VPIAECPLVSIVVVSWNRRADIDRCLRSLLDLTYPHLEIILVDNDSRDGTVDMVREQFPMVQVIASNQNLGCGPARNVGFKAASGKYLVQIDDDATINPDSITQMVNAFELEPQVGAIAFRIVNYPSGRDCTADFGKYTKNFWGAGAGIRAAVWREVGPYPRKEYFSTEEFDFCIRVHDAGYLIRYLPEVTVSHYPAGDRKRISPWRMRYAMASWLWLFPKYFPWRLVPIFWTRVLVSYFMLAIRDRRLGAFLSAIVFAISGMPSSLRARRRLNPATIKYFWDPHVPPDRFSVGVWRKLFRKAAKLKSPLLAGALWLVPYCR
jgi:GT2 family glycosyltransferase